MTVSEKELQLLAPFLEGNRPTHINTDRYTGEQTREWYMHCPLPEHGSGRGDAKRSGSLNIDKGLYHCNVCGGMSIRKLMARQSEFVGNGHVNGKVLNLNGGVAKPIVELNEGMIAGWHSALVSHPGAIVWLKEERGITLDTIKQYEIGYNSTRRLYTIPVRSAEGEIWNVRYYNPDPPEGRRKIWGETGYNQPRLYPAGVLGWARQLGHVIVCEGEWDALLTIQRGFPAITRTGAADVWDAGWSAEFKGLTAYVCHDRDDKGQSADAKLARFLRPVADVRKIELPYAIVEKHGKDLTDFWLEHTSDEFRELMARAVAVRKKRQTPSSGDRSPASASDQAEGSSASHESMATVEDAADAINVGKPLSLKVTVKGRKEPGYTIPREVKLACSQDAGNKCAICPMRAAEGNATVRIEPDDPVVLELIDSNNSGLKQIIAESFGVPGGKCIKLQQEVQEHMAVEILFARPALDYSDGSITDPSKAASYKTLKITSVGRHNTPANNTISVRGALQPNPHSQSNEFLVHELTPLETSIDHFVLDDATRSMLMRFQSDKPLQKLAEISKQLAQHVTRIHGRPEMHALMDLTFHSLLSFNFAGERIDRGWLESLIVGDTRTGKSLAAQRLVKHYGAGEVISCEAASFAGVVGGLQTIGSKDWVVTWGVVPLNDRRLVVLDEVSGLSYEEIAQMSDIRSSGQAKLVKIQQETTWARTRLLWLGNPRNTTMANYTYGVDAVKPLVGNAEDVARFDLAMAVTLFDVPSDEINRPPRGGDLLYTSEACHKLLMWAWTRTPDQIVFTDEAEEAVFREANAMGKLYIEDPPLIQAANVRIKIARIAAALAARTYSTDSSGERVMVHRVHVQDAVRFINLLYGMDSFGYRERSRERISDRATAEANRDKMAQYLKSRPQLAKYLRGAGKFRRQDLDEIMNISRDESNGIISTLYENRMVRKVLSDIVVEPTLHSLLRELKL